MKNILTTKNNLTLEELKKFLDPLYYKLLILYYKHYTFKEITENLHIKRKDLVLHFIYLGKKLMLYELNCDLIPKETQEDYLRGFNNCKLQILNRRKENEHKQRRETHKKRKN
jgi:hypothetical protein